MYTFGQKFLVRALLILCTLVISLTLVACSAQGNSDLEEETGGGETHLHVMDDQISESYTEAVSLSSDIDSLISETHIRLSISQQDGVFIPASDSFSQRILRLIEAHGEPVAKVADIGQYDLTLKFDGYSDIHLNLEMNTFWFEGVDHLYAMHHAFSDQWDRYIIRMVDGELMYEAFEKTILQKIFYEDYDGNDRTATLFHDGDIRLRIEDAEVVITSNVKENSLNFINSGPSLTSYSVKTLGDEPLFAVVSAFHSTRGANATLDLFAYEEEIQNIFSTADWKFEIDAIDYEKGEAIVRLPFFDTTFTYRLTDDERAHTNEKIAELNDHHIQVDQAYIKSVQDGIVFRPVEIIFPDTDEDGADDIRILGDMRTVGARTPVHIHTDAVFEFEITGHSIQFKDVTFE